MNKNRLLKSNILVWKSYHFNFLYKLIHFYQLGFLLPIFYLNVSVKIWTLHKKWSFPLRISSINVTKSPGNCGFGHTFTEEIRNGKLHFFIQWEREGSIVHLWWPTAHVAQSKMKYLARLDKSTHGVSTLLKIWKTT